MQNSQVKSATRAIEILEYFKLFRQPRAMSEIAIALGYPQSSTTVLLKTLVTLGYLNFDRKERLYFPTPKVTALGDWVPRALFGTGRVLEALRDVHAATGETASINTRNDVYLQYVKIIQSVHALRFHVDEGTLRPLTQSAVGRLLLSTLSDDKIDNTVRRANIATPRAADRVKISDMMERVREIRQQGYAWTDHDPEPARHDRRRWRRRTGQAEPRTLPRDPPTRGQVGRAERPVRPAHRHRILKEKSPGVARENGGIPWRLRAPGRNFPAL